MDIKKQLILLLGVLYSLSFAGESVDISRYGRKIQLDGFLMDWVEKNRHTWNGSTVWSWDAINTAEGVAGYFHASSAAVCSSWTFQVDANRHGIREMVTSYAKDTGASFYRVNSSSDGNNRTITMEWLLPWDAVAIDSNGTYAITLAGNSICGDSLEPILLTGKVVKSQKALPAHFAERLIIIGVLLLAFIVLQITIRKKNLRKGSPRQST
jgi:hypothetical protein